MTRSAADIRREFLEFFRQRGHAIVDPSPVVPYDDPTLLFTNAGMNQFKDVFLGGGARPYRRAADSQPCIRAGGKHNDLDDVGHDTYHHTFFEMLGNWSFGDYFKAEAIEWAWELLTKVWGLDPRRLHATYFGGDESEGLEPDEEARGLWARIAGLPPERIHAGSKKDNFWEMGDTGPCGPCSEIHIDLTADLSGARLVNAGDARVIEIWNLVFIQFNRGPDGRLTPLPARHVDTGMGFERICAVVRGFETGRVGQVSNYDTDVFAPVMKAIERVSGAPAYGGRLESSAGGDDHAAVMRDVSYRVIADHVRTLAFAIADGAVPDKEGRGYVLRRILRRGVRYGWQYLGLKRPFLCELVETVVGTMGDAFPKLRENPARVVEIVREEEASFARTLERGIALFEEAVARAREHHGEIRGDDAFRLHDTFGFPIDLTQIMADERGLRVDIGEYERLMEAARERAREGGRGAADWVAALPPAAVSALDKTDDAPKYSVRELVATVAAVFCIESDGRVTQPPPGGALRAGQRGVVVLDRTCFYGEQGGQCGDTGQILTGEDENDSADVFEVQNTIRVGDAVAHVGHVRRGAVGWNAPVRVRVDARRSVIEKNHTATHVLNWALRETLGEHVQQKGSLVDPEKTRFDFSHPKALDADVIEQIEQRCGEQIRADYEVFASEAPQAEALRINGLRAVFGEKYPERVRVVSIGRPVEDLLRDPGNAEWRRYSIEFCGGTHVKRTSEIEAFVLVAEEAVAKGVRRVVGISGSAAREAIKLGEALLAEAQELAKSPGDDVAARVADLQRRVEAATIPLRARHALRERLAELQQLVRQQQKAAAAESAGVARERLEELLKDAPRRGETTLVVGEMPDVPADQLKHAADVARSKCGSAAVLFGVRAGEKAMLLAAMTDDLIQRGLKAGDLVKAIAPLVGGGGGGPPTLAQAGGKSPEKLAEALEAGRAWIIQKLGG